MLAIFISWVVTRLLSSLWLLVGYLAVCNFVFGTSLSCSWSSTVDSISVKEYFHFASSNFSTTPDFVLNESILVLEDVITKYRFKILFQSLSNFFCLLLNFLAPISVSIFTSNTSALFLLIIYVFFFSILYKYYFCTDVNSSTAITMFLVWVNNPNDEKVTPFSISFFTLIFLHSIF